MKRKKAWFNLLPLALPILLLSILLGGCTTRTAQTDQLNPGIVTAQNQFGFHLYHQLAAESQGGDNIFISPASISLALAMAYNGAAGATQEAMAQTMGLADLSWDDINSSYAALLQYMAGLSQKDPSLDLRIANGLWQDEKIQFDRAFLQRNKRYYNATTRALDFGDPNSVEVINTWVSQQTEGRIQDLLDRISPQDVLFLINAVYFKADWKRRFNPNVTRPQPFQRADGEVKQIDMMHMEGTFDYFQTPTFQSLRLPYGENEAVAMYLFLPNQPGGMEQFQAQLNADNWQEWMRQFSSQKGRIALPRFQLDFKSELTDILKKLGMGIAFDNAADFSNMRAKGSQHHLAISEVIHQSFLLVNEEGSEAAAATSVGIRLTSMPMYQFEFIADRPFFLAIRDEVHGSILFLGEINNPMPVKTQR